MRIIAGAAKGRPILAPGGDATRPTLDRVKESLFNILQFSIPGARVLDLFAGSGNLGLEALSRGAAFAVFNDRSRICGECIRRNITTLGFQPVSLLLQLDALEAIHRLKSEAPFDIVFLDPPYETGAGEALPALFTEGLLSEKGIAAVEHEWKSPPALPPGHAALFRLFDQRKYRDTGISFYERALDV